MVHISTPITSSLCVPTVRARCKVELIGSVDMAAYKASVFRYLTGGTRVAARGDSQQDEEQEPPAHRPAPQHLVAFDAFRARQPCSHRQVSGAIQLANHWASGPSKQGRSSGPCSRTSRGGGRRRPRPRSAPSTARRPKAHTPCRSRWPRPASSASEQVAWERTDPASSRTGPTGRSILQVRCNRRILRWADESVMAKSGG